MYKMKILKQIRSTKTPTLAWRRVSSSWVLISCIFVAMVFYMHGCGGAPLKPWHTVKLTEEYTARKADEIKTFNSYQQLENRLFAQLDEQIYSRTETGFKYEIFRYSSGSMADPRNFATNWNRSFELPTAKPIGGVLLLHGMSDSPYSLRALGKSMSENNYWVIATRLPGHGTAPSELKRIDWKDMASVVRLSVDHLVAKVGQKPIHIVGYSTGAALALNFVLDVMEGSVSPMPASLIFISPAIGIHPAAGLSGLKNGLSYLPGLGHLAWNSIQPEFDPFKYNSFATNAGTQVYRLTTTVRKRISKQVQERPESLSAFPPLLVFQSTVDATVSSVDIVHKLLKPLGPQGHELVLFDINRFAAGAPLLTSDPGHLTNQLMADDSLPFSLTLVTNENPESFKIHARHKAPFGNQSLETESLTLTWPYGVISLSHIALPFPPNDPLYGKHPPDTDHLIYLGQVALKGERGLLKISNDWLLRMRYNPFYKYLEKRTLSWMNRVKEGEPD